MKLQNRFLGILGKVFLYTMLILMIVICGMFLFFSNQIKSTVTVTQQRQAAEAFHPLLKQLNGKSNKEIIAFAEEFHEKNRSFNFRFEAESGEVLFQTENFEMSEDWANIPRRDFIPRDNLLGNGRFNFYKEKLESERALFLARAENGVRLYVASPFAGASIYGAVLEKAAWIFGLIFLGSLLAAFLFARRIAKPIQKLSADTHKMFLLEPVDAPKGRRDEIGQLSKDVYAMYSKLKSTIDQLETEIARVKRMEENQRYFFSAASHELKTPIAATGAILEGMLSDVITPEEYPDYLRECMKLIGEQNKLVSEILELVKLSGEAPAQEKEPVNLTLCVNSVLEPLLPLTESKEQRLTVEIAEDMKCELNAGLFSKVLSNVLLNAVQNSPNSAEIRIQAKEGNECILLSVWNSDAQIAKDILPKLFEPFYRADEARTSGDGRSGLGLTIVKKALDFMEIPFKMENAEGGVLFQVEISKK